MSARGTRSASVIMRYKDAGDWCRASIVARTHVGAAYIDLHFAGCAEPTEVINVYDYAAGKSLIETRTDIRAKLLEWIAEQDEQEALDADSPAEAIELTRRPRRRWLLTYLENAPLR